MRLEFKDISQIIYLDTVTFGIDEFLLKLLKSARSNPVKDRWQGREDDLVAIGRRTLEVARNNAASCNRDVGLDRQDWQLASHLASKAHEAISELIEHLASPSALLRQGEPVASDNVPLPVRLSAPIIQMLSLQAVLDGRRKSQQPVKQGKAAAASLCDAAEILGKVAAMARGYDARIAEARQNPGDPEKGAFASEMLRGWIYLTGQRPGKANVCFQAFLETGWNDICVAEASNWENAARKAGAMIPDDEVRIIAMNGPDWF